MLSVDALRSKPVGDVDLGHLIVIFPPSGKTQFAIRVEPPDETEYRGKPTVLAFETPWVGVSDDLCLDFGMAPEFIWGAQVTELISDRRPPAGHLAVLNDCVAVSASYTRPYDQPLAYWDIQTGKIVTRADGAIFIKKWQLGVRDIAGQFSALHSFPPQSRPGSP